MADTTLQTVPVHRICAIMHASGYRQVMPETIAFLIEHGELRCQRVGYVDRVPLVDVHRVLRSWNTQKEDAR